MRMSPDEIEFFENELKCCKHYLEYGAGGSTLLAARVKTIKNITSVESDPEFVHAEVQQDIAVKKAIEDLRVQMLVIDIGSTGEWGVPVNDEKKHLWPNYALSPFNHNFNTPDLVLVDGRFRVACAIASAMSAPSARILIHDYSDREKYRVLEELLEIEKSVHTLFKFRRRSDFNQKKAEKLLKLYLYAPSDESQSPYARFRRYAGGIKRKLLHI